MLAVARGDADFVRYFIEKTHIDILAKNNDGKDILDIVKSYGHKEVEDLIYDMLNKECEFRACKNIL